MSSSPPGIAVARAEFRKLSNDSTNRKYRRHSPISASSTSSESPRRARSSSPNSSVEKTYSRNSEWRRKDYKREVVEEASGRSNRGRCDGRRSDRFSRNRDYDKYSDSEDRKHRSYRYGRMSKGDAYLDSERERTDRNQSQDRARSYEKYCQEKYDSPKDRGHVRRYHEGNTRALRRPEEYGKSRTRYHDESREKRNNYVHGGRECMSDNNKSKEHCMPSHAKVDDKTMKHDESSSSSKKAKLSPEAAKQSESIDVKPSEQLVSSSEATGNLGAAKVAAMKAAELVNRNLVGVGTASMSTEQKKKLLWGGKKAAASEDTGRQWDTSSFSDREREEKFKKLMGVKGDLRMEQSPKKQDGGDAERQKVQLDLEKQYTAGLRRRDGRTVGLGL